MAKDLSNTAENTILSNKFIEFKKSAKELPVHINTTKHDLPNLFKTYSYTVCSWPVIIDTKTSNEIADLSVNIPRLLRKIPKLYFDNNLDKLADYYFEGNKMKAECALICCNKNIESSCRLDLTFTDDGFKVLEANIGTSIGGWQIQSFEKIIRKYHPQLHDEKTAKNFNTHNSLANYMKFLVDQILERVADLENEINLYVGIGHTEQNISLSKNLGFFDVLFKAELHRRGLRGQVFSGALSRLKLRNNKLFLNDLKIISGVIIWDSEQTAPIDLFRAFVTDAIYSPDHYGIMIYTDKRNLGILRTLAEQQKFDKTDNELIMKSIPWTSELKDKKVIYKNAPISLVELLKKRREDFVIKAAISHQGKDVYIGKFTTQQTWEEIIAKTLTKGQFVAQEFMDSINFNAPNANNEWTPHKLIWGAFGFGKYHGGVWVRMLEVGKGGGVINSARGAVEAIVFESV